MKCKKENKDKIEYLADSGALMMFTHERSDLIEYEELAETLTVQTASKGNTLTVKGKVFLDQQVRARRGNKLITKIISLYPVYYIPNLSMWLLSIGCLLANGLELQ